MHHNLFAIAFCVAALTSFASSAQQNAVSPHPADSGAAVAVLKYESAFVGYLPYRDEKLAPWRDVNDEVARAGGQAGILGGASGHSGHGAAKPAVKSPASAPVVPSPAVPHVMPMGSHEGMKK